MHRFRHYIFSLIILSLLIGCTGGHPPVFVTDQPPPNSGTLPEDDADDTARLDGPGDDTHLTDGHPIEGINYHRNNRSPYLLPLELSADDTISPIYYNYSPGYPNFAGFSDLAISDDERIYFGRYIGEDSIGFGGGIYSLDYDLLSFYFDGPVETLDIGGMRIVLTNAGIYTSDRDDYLTLVNLHGVYLKTEKDKWSLVYVRDWPEIAEEKSASWYQHTEDVGSYWWDDDFRPFRDIFPLPGWRILVTYDDIDSGEAIHLQVLGGNLEVIQEEVYQYPITGLAYDEDTSSTYVSTKAGLHYYDSQFLKKWDTLQSCDGFSDGIPVVLDNGYIAGVAEGILRVVDREGTLLAEKDYGAELRPAVLNDGVLVVITSSTLVFFDASLNEIGEVPLPSGPDSGEFYTRPPLVDAIDNMAFFTGPDLYIVGRHGNVIAKRTFESDVQEIRLGPEHLFVALDYEIYRFPS